MKVPLIQIDLNRSFAKPTGRAKRALTPWGTRQNASFISGLMVPSGRCARYGLEDNDIPEHLKEG